MSSTVNQIGSFLAERIAVGLSTIVGVTAWPGQVSVLMKIVSGSSLEIGGTYCLDGSGATTAFTWGKGYLISTTEARYNMIGQFYLAATGATVVVEVLRERSPGQEP